MFNILFGDIKTGRLLRLQYIGYSLLIAFPFFAFMMLVVLAIGAGEHILGGNLQEAQDQLRQWFTLPFMLVFGVFMAVVAFVSFNLMAKRFRDMGLPGWWAVLAIVVQGMIVSASVSEQAGGVFHTVIWLLLLFVPSNALKKE